MRSEQYVLRSEASAFEEEFAHFTGCLPITEEYAVTVLSIPLYNGMTEEEQIYVIDTFHEFW